MKPFLILIGLGAVSCALITKPSSNNHKTLITRDDVLSKRMPSATVVETTPETLGATGNLTSTSNFISVVNPGETTSISSTLTTNSFTKVATDSSTSTSSISSASASGAATSGSQSVSVLPVETLWTALDASLAPQPSSAFTESKSAVSTTTIISTIASVPSTTSSQETVAMYDQQFASWSKDNKGNFLEPGPTPAPAPTPSIRCSYDHIKHIGDGEYVQQEGISCGTSVPGSTSSSSSTTVASSTTMPSTSSASSSPLDNQSATTPGSNAPKPRSDPSSSAVDPAQAALDWLTSTTAPAHTGSTATVVATVDAPATSTAAANRLRPMFW